MAPYISFVVAAQNIATHGNLLERLQASMDSIRSCGLDAEYILIEWNPPGDRPGLKTALRWDPAGIHARLITVPQKFHETLPNPYKQLFFEWHAKNVGIRASLGYFVCCMNADDLLPAYSAAEIRELRGDSFYRMNRFDLRIPPGKPPQLFLIKRANGDFIPGERHIGVSKTPVPFSLDMLHFNASGDFLCMSRENWIRLHGYPETGYDGSVDGQMVWIAHRMGLRQVVLESPLYHLDHPRAGRIMYTPPWSDAAPFGEMNRGDRWGRFTP